MILYFAGVPGGPQVEREVELSKNRDIPRLLAFFYYEQMMTTLRHYKRIDDD